MIEAYRLSARLPMMAFDTPPMALGATTLGDSGTLVKKVVLSTGMPRLRS